MKFKKMVLGESLIHQVGVSNLRNFHIFEFEAHRDALTSISFIKIPEKHILSTSLDKYVKIFKLNGENICKLNINHPLPIKWNVNYTHLHNLRNKVLFALKVIEAIFKRYYNILYMEGKIFDVKKFIEECKNPNIKIGNQGSNANTGNDGRDRTFAMTEILTDKLDIKRPVIVTMKDEYTAKDFAYDQMKRLDRDEITGNLFFFWD
jgi:hypothetical protein